MDFPADQTVELKELCPGVKHAEEGGHQFFLLPQLHLPDGTTPAVIDALLCASPRDGYESRLFFAQKVTSKNPLNWNAENVSILGRTWFAFSRKTQKDLRLTQMVAEHLLAFR